MRCVCVRVRVRVRLSLSLCCALRDLAAWGLLIDAFAAELGPCGELRLAPKALLR